MPALSSLNPFATGDGTLLTTPWRWRDATDPGLYVGHNKQVWLYREVPLTPVQWEDPHKRLEAGRSVETVLEEIGARSKDVGQGIRALARNKQIHIVCVTYDFVAGLPANTPERLKPFLEEVLEEVATAKSLLIGVRLESSALTKLTKTRGGLGKKLKAVVEAANEDVEGGLDHYYDDFRAMNAIFKRARMNVPRPESVAQLEAWFNHGVSADAAMAFTERSFQVIGGREYEISTAMNFEITQMRAPNAQWLLDAMTHSDPAVAISIRAELEPASVTRSRLRKRRRSLREQEAEEARTGDIEREENAENLALAADMETYVRQSGTPWLTECSILMAREVSAADETYADMLRDRHGIGMKVLEHRQLQALSEMLPCSGTRVNPFSQDLNPAMVAYSGLAGFSNLGDARGVFAGYVDPDYVPMFLDPEAASRQNKPPVMGVFGDPGSGKTFASQLIAGQYAIAGGTSVFVNPKSADSLAPWAHWCESMGAPINLVVLSEMSDNGGSFDPFRFCEPTYAAEVLTRHILTAMFGAFNYEQEILLQDGLRRGAEEGARCANDALNWVEDEYVQRLVRMKANSSPLFALGFGNVPQPEWDQRGGLTLIEFGRDLPLPTPGKSPEYYEASEREAVAAMRLVTRAAIEILIRARGGVLVVDEAHHFLGSEEGMKSLDRLAREGRSMGLLPIFATQRVTDLLDADMETFMSRVLVMKLNDNVEADAALQLCRLRTTKDRLDFLRQAGPQQAVNGQPSRAALGIFRDLDDRHAVVSIGPIPEHVRMAMSTNRSDREERDKATRETENAALENFEPKEEQ